MIAFVRKNRDFYEVIEINKEVTALLEKGAAVMVEVPLRELLKHSIEYKGELYRDIINLYTSNTEWGCLDIEPSNMSDDDIDMLKHLKRINENGYQISAIKSNNLTIFFYTDENDNAYVDMDYYRNLELYGKQYSNFRQDITNLKVAPGCVFAIQKSRTINTDKFIEMLDEFRAPIIRFLDIIYNQPNDLIYLQWWDNSAFEPLQTKEDKEGNLLIETEYQDKPIRADAIYYDRVKEVFVTPEGACFEIFKLYDKKAIEDITNV